VQFRAVKGDVETSRERLVALVERAAVDADLVVCPEMAVTGYVFEHADDVRRVAEPARGPTFEALREVARTRRCFVVAGFPEIDGDTLYNSAWVIDDRGELAFVYRKTLLYTEDLHWAEPGDSGYHAFDVAGVRVGVGICMDLNDDRFVDWIADAECEAVAFPTNWVRSDDDQVDTWTYWAWRLGGLSAALVAANTWGCDGDIEFSGRSAVLADRTIHAALPPCGDGVLRATIEATCRRPGR
ncbi:MAG: carbon-nitrogen hydrolase family protein, partial [Myxococcota bacterium]